MSSAMGPPTNIPPDEPLMRCRICSMALRLAVDEHGPLIACEVCKWYLHI